MRQGPSPTIAGRMLAGLFVVCVGILAVAYVQGQSLDVVYVPTPRETVDRMLQVAEVGPKDYVIDLGSGDGRIAIAAGRLGARALGVDLDPARIRDAELNAQRAGVTDRVTFRLQNLFETDLSEATVLTMYLLPSINVKLRPKILGLRPGTRVVSHDFTMGDWKPDLTETVNWRIHFWVVPARVAGNWQVRSGNQDFCDRDRADLPGVQGNRDGRGPHAAAAQYQAARHRDRVRGRRHGTPDDLSRHGHRRHDAGFGRRRRDRGARRADRSERTLPCFAGAGPLLAGRHFANGGPETWPACSGGFFIGSFRTASSRLESSTAMAIADAEVERRRLGALEQLAEPRLIAGQGRSRSGRDSCRTGGNPTCRA